ncbi:MAG: HD domain-containing protein [Muribaculaceae bacterium]|nr:HD domain-containing protein [Roseburia sp.]MCM1432199.1 HD domain-containing protein [Muribaculaceae bacterium]MCM1493934.1 HD domain-containing protein [Muribaculaceae bacterium]
MRIKSVAVLNGGEVLAESVLTSEKSVLIPKGTALKADYVPLIQSLGIEALMVEDPYEHLEEPNTIIHPLRLQAYVERVQKLIENHIYHGKKSLFELEVIAHEIVREIDSMPEDAVFDMNERTANLYEHTVMVTLLSVAVAKKLRLDHKRRYHIAIGCLLHDIGIRYITVGYENRDWTAADAADIFEYKKHTILGYSALDEEPWVPDIARKMVLFHHEKLDGSGFPMRQKNRETECRIIQACDTFDCYISGMECRRMSVQEALQQITADGLRYEQKIVEHLVTMIAKYPVGTKVRTSDEAEGVVVSQTLDPENPIIMVINTEDKNYRRNLMLEKNTSILQIV